MAISDYPLPEYMQQAVREENGRVFWLERPLSHFKDEHDWNAWNGKFAGEEAGCYDKSKNRFVIGHNDILIPRYHIVWMLYHSEWPSRLDHENRNPTDDRIENLRTCTQRQNIGNSRLSKRNKSGYKGVSWSKGMKKWLSRLGIHGKPLHLGYFDDPKKAHDAYMEAARRHFGDGFAHDGT